MFPCQTLIAFSANLSNTHNAYVLCYVKHFAVLHSGEYFIHGFRLISSIQQWHGFAYIVVGKCSNLRMASLTDKKKKKSTSQSIVGWLWMNNISFLDAKLMAVVYVLKFRSFDKTQFEINKFVDIYVSWDTLTIFMCVPYVLQFVPYKQAHNHHYDFIRNGGEFSGCMAQLQPLSCVKVFMAEKHIVAIHGPCKLCAYGPRLHSVSSVCSSVRVCPLCTLS